LPELNFIREKKSKILLPYLRILANPADLISLERIINVPSRGNWAEKMGVIFQDADYKKYGKI